MEPALLLSFQRFFKNSSLTTNYKIRSYHHLLSVMQYLSLYVHAGPLNQQGKAFK